MSRSGYRSETVRHALLASSHARCQSYTRCQTFLGPDPTSGLGDDPPREWSTMPVSTCGSRRRRSWWCHTCSSTPQHPHPCEAGGVIARLDMGPHGIPRGCQLSGQASDGGPFEAQLSDRPADRPGAQTRPGCAHLLSAFQECHRLAGAFSAYPSPYCATGSAPGPRPRARRSPPPPHAHDLERFSPHPGQSTSWLHDSTSSTRASGVRVTLIRWKPSKPTSRSHRSQRSSDTEQQQVGPDTARGT